MSSEDLNLINLWRKGDENAARIIVDGYVDRLQALARRHLHQRVMARVDPEDIVQSAFRTFFARAKAGQFVFSEQDDLCKLLVRITLNKTLRQVAFHKAAKRDPCQEAPRDEHHTDRIASLLGAEPSPEAQVAFLDQLEHFLGQLEPQQRQIVELRMEGFSNEEICQTLGIHDRKIRRVIEKVRVLARLEGLTPPDDAQEKPGSSGK
jgi:RNA polymerase sigma-70 factor (ECF subfamily)